MLFAVALKNLTGGRVNMFDNPLLRTTIQFPLYTFVAPVGSVPFADSRALLQARDAHLTYMSYSQGNYALYNKLAEELNSPQAKWLAELFRPFDSRRRPLDFDLYSIIWPEAEIEPSLPDSSKMSMHFRTIDWVIMRASWEDENVPILAAKGGIHDDPPSRTSGLRAVRDCVPRGVVCERVGVPAAQWFGLLGPPQAL